MESHDTFTCPACRQARALSEATHGADLPPSAAAAVQRNHPYWSPAQVVCRVCANEGKADEMAALLKAEMGPLTDLEAEVLDSIRLDRLLSADADDEFEQEQGRAERFGNRVVSLVGSLPFAVGILFFLLSWLVVNVLGRPFEPYPMVIFAGMGAVLASLAGLQGPIILMSQRYSRRRDQLRSKHEYRINLKAELEIQYLTEQVEQVLRRQRQILDLLECQPEAPPHQRHDADA